MSHQWQEKVRPIRLERRYEFQNYTDLSNFLNAASEISEREGIFPDMGFGKNYVNATIHMEEGDAKLGELHHRLATALDSLASNSDY
ncbi:MAG: 4a-hydroxytetrahydrobiopterin dehydratase [Gammaproteobacteria bacterium]|nr:4a-hydroxytetrahydrobiopterin dehydratase [Gammaproteobacteria bacterium]